MSAREFYQNYWSSFSHSNAGPNIHTPDVPSLKHNQECYRKFAKSWPLGFMLVATANKKNDHISAQFFSGNANRGHDFLNWLDPSAKGSVTLRSGAIVQIHKNNTDGKIELFWTAANLADEAFWPSHFLWFRIALHELAESFGPRLDVFCEKFK